MSHSRITGPILGDTFTSSPRGLILIATNQSHRRPILTTTHGTHRGAFGPVEWGLLLTAALMWGSTYFLTATGLDSFKPGALTLIRLAVALIVIWMFPKARAVKIDRTDLPRLTLISIVWIGAALGLIPIALQYVDSSLAGMLTAVQPINMAGVAAILLRKAPGRFQVAGLAIGLIGALTISASSVGQGNAQPIGVVLMLVTVTTIGAAVVISAPLQQKYGAVAVTARMLTIGGVVLLPFGLIDLPGSHFSWMPFLAIVALGIFGTALPQAVTGALVGRAGATRASFNTYLIPIVAIVLGVALRGEELVPLSLVGIALTLIGAALATRAET